MKRTAFVTGGGGYIGSAVAQQLANDGYAVAVCDISESAVEKTVSRLLASGYSAAGYVADVSDSASIENAMIAADANFGGLDVMVHVAGGSARVAGEGAQYRTLVNQEDYVIDRVLKINLYGAIYASRAAARIMIKRGVGGRIINFSSVVGLNGLKYCTEYAAAKGGVIALTKSLAKELGEYKITVNSVAPGIVMRPDEKTSDDYATATNFLGERCTADDVADLVAFLSSDRARFITGQVYAIDGGRSLAMKGSE